MIEALGDVSVQDVFGFMIDAGEDGFDRIMTSVSWAEAIAVRFEAGFPLRSQRQFGERLRRPIGERRDA